MMNQRLSARLLSVLLCIVLVLGMVPAVSAATVSSVAITGVSVPSAGATPSNSASVPADSGYTVGNVSWVGWQGDGSASAVSGTFQAGWYYQVRITLTAGADTQFDAALTATVNGSGQSVEVVADGGSSVTVKRTFYVEAEIVDAPISAVSVSGLTAPAAGQTADFTVSPGDSSYSVSQVIWYNADSSVTLSQSEKFVAGVRYQVQIILEAASGYSFSNSVSGNLNGSSAVCGAVTGKDAAKYVAILQEYTISSENQITQVAITDLTTPVKGAAPDVSVTVASSAQYVVDSVSWKKWKTSDSSTSAVTMSSQEKFLSGYNYRVNIVLRAKTDYSFATNSAGEPAVSGTVNGAAALPAVSVDGKNGAQYVCICFDYSLEAKVIQSVSVADVIEPFAGQSPSNRTRVSPEALYTVDKIFWEMRDGEQPSGDFTQMNDIAIFTGGMFYRVNVVLKAKEGAEFAVGENRQSTVTGTINGAATRPAESYGGKDLTEYICISYEFPMLTDFISHVEIYKIDEPQEGKYPDLEGKVPDDALYTIDQVTWERREKDLAKYVKLSSYETFEEDQDYRVTIRLRAKSGGSFYVNQYEELQVTATVNGMATMPAEAIDNLDPKDYVAVSYDYSLSADNNVIRQVNVHDLDIPRAGETPDYQVNTDAVAKYTVDSVVWERLQNRRATTSGEQMTPDSTFQEGQYYRVLITLKAGEDAIFNTDASGRPQVTAVLNNGNGMAAELVTGKDPETYICISYIYGVYSVIEGGDAQWSPDKGTLKFRFTGDFENFVGLRVDGKLLEERMYTAASGSTIITLQESFLNALADGIYELTVIYTDGQVSTKFQISGGSVSEGNGGFRINAWFFLLPPMIGILAGLFFAAFIVKKRAENRVHKEMFEEYDEDDDDYEDDE